MTTATAIPSTTLTTARVELEKELSGPQWCARYPRSKSIATLQPKFQLAVSSFLWALQQAGATFEINNTYRPKEACYLMHYAWMIFKKGLKPENVPELAGVNINWIHGNIKDSVKAANDMCDDYQISNLQDAPALDSNHTKGLAIDIAIGWSGSLKIKNASDEDIVIDSSPHDNMNKDLWEVGKSYGVIRYFRPEKDKPHWSIDGH